MPCKIKIRVISARDLPVMDTTSQLTDAFLEIRFGEREPLRTSIKWKTLDPVWNEDFRLDIDDDTEVQDEPLEIKVRPLAVGAVLLVGTLSSPKRVAL